MPDDQQFIEVNIPIHRDIVLDAKPDELKAMLGEMAYNAASLLAVRT